jgi:predicted RNase H-like nuclease (RuvC/YqgF family)
MDMDTTFINKLDKTTARYVREALTDTDTDKDVSEQLAEVTRQAAEVAQDVEAGASPADALTFTREVRAVLDGARAKALEAQRLQAEIEAKQLDVSETQAEIEKLSTSMPALAVAVNRAYDVYEEARQDYNAQEFNIATLSIKLSMRRSEMAELRRRLAQIKAQEV